MRDTKTVREVDIQRDSPKQIHRQIHWTKRKEQKQTRETTCGTTTTTIDGGKLVHN